MSRFFVGQRVRLARLVKDVHLNGTETRISGRYDGADFGCDGVGWRVFDGDAWCEEGHLEPILPEGAAPSEFITLADLLTSLEAHA